MIWYCFFENKYSFNLLAAYFFSIFSPGVLLFFSIKSRASIKKLIYI